MPARTSYAHGTPSWVDCNTTDQAAAKSFYGGLFGWDYDDQDMGEGAVYSMATKNGSHVAAISPLQPDQAQMGIPPHWNSHITVDDVDATADTIVKAGGTVMAPPFDVMDAGRMTVAVDPTGAIFMAWQAKNHPGAGLVNEDGTFSWSELLSSDVPKAAEFYAAVFGWRAETHPGEMPYTEFKLGDRSIAGAMAPPMPGMPNLWSIYFSVDDCDAAVEKAKELGGAVFNGPMDIQPGRFAVLADPQGAMFNVITMSTPGD